MFWIGLVFFYAIVGFDMVSYGHTDKLWYKNMPLGIIQYGLYLIECFEVHVITTMLDHATYGHSFDTAITALQIQFFFCVNY